MVEMAARGVEGSRGLATIEVAATKSEMHDLQRRMRRRELVEPYLIVF